MKFQLIALAFGWGCFIFKLYQQYKHLRARYEIGLSQKIQQKILQQNAQKQNKNNNSNIFNQFTHQNKKQQIEPYINISEQKEGNYNIRQLSLNKQLDQTNDDLSHIVFPELYPHLKKKKSIKKDNQALSRIKQLKSKRQLKKYKQWFITNRILMQIHQSGHMTQDDIKFQYQNLTSKIKQQFVSKNILNQQKNQQNLNQISQIIIKTDHMTKNIKNMNTKILDFLQEEQKQNNQIQKYDPFVYN